MFCIECGFKSIESAKFCKRCGTNLNQEVDSSQHQINETHNAAPVNNNLQPQTNPQQEPQQADVGSTNKNLVTGILWLIAGMFLILFGPFLLVGRWPYIGLQLTGIEMLIWISFIFAAVYGILAISCRNHVKLKQTLSKGSVIPGCVYIMVILPIIHGRGDPFEFFFDVGLGIMFFFPYYVGLMRVLHFDDWKN